MLLAVRSGGIGHCSGDVIDRIAQKWGKPKAVLRDGGGLVAAWAEPDRRSATHDEKWVLEGWIAPRVTDLSPPTLCNASGDFVLFGLSQGGVVLATGRAGGYRPIYVAWRSSDVVVACTQLSALLEGLPDHPRPDISHLADCLLSGATVSSESTPYVGVRRVPMGQAWSIGHGQKLDRWSTVLPVADQELRDDENLAFRLRAEITRAARQAAEGAAAVGVEVSGGLDSSMLLSVLVSEARAGHITRPPEAFTYESAAPHWADDRSHLRALEVHLGVGAHRVAPSDGAALVGRLMVVDSAPAPSPMLSAAAALGAAARARGVEAVITGDGGDQVLDGNPRLFGELARRGAVRKGLNGALRTRGVFYGGPAARLARFILRPIVEPMLPTSAVAAMKRLRRRSPRWAGPALRRHLNLVAEPPSAPLRLDEPPSQRYERLLGWPFFSRWSAMRLQEELVGRYTIRSPFFDDDFLRFVATIPPLSLMRGGYLRGLLREAMRGFVPENLRLRETKGTFYFFVEQALAKAGGLDVLTDLVDVRMLADLGLVEPRPFRKFFDGFRRAADDDASFADLWQVLSTEASLRQHAGLRLLRAA